MTRLRLTYILLLCCLAMPAAAQQWTFRAPMNAPRAGMAVAVLDGRIIVVGGEDPFGKVLDTATQYDPQTDRWVSLPRMQVGRIFATAVAFDGKIFVMGGLDGDGNVLDDVEFYDPADNRWRSFESMEEKRQGLVAVLRGSNLFVAGGSDEGDAILASIERYDGVEWAAFFGLGENDMPSQLGEPRAAFAAVAVGQEVFFMGGLNRGGPLSLVQRLGADDRFEVLMPLPSARGNLAAAAIDDTLYVMGGRDGSERVLDDVQRLDQTSGTWTPMPRLLIRRESCAAVAVNGVLYVIGGRDDRGRVLDSVEAFGEEVLPTATDEGAPGPPGFRLEQNYPNPFRSSTTIPFAVSEQGASRRVTLSVYDLQGRRVAVLVDGILAPGPYTATWDGTGRGGVPVGSGLYVYRLQQGALEVRNLMAIIR